MKHTKLSAAALAFTLLLFFVSCQKEIRKTTDFERTTVERSVSANKAPLAVAKLTREQIEARLNQLLPERKERAIANAKLALTQHPEYRELIQRAIQPDPNCDGNTPLNQWLDAELVDWDYMVYIYALFTGMLDFPANYAFVFENSPEGQYFGKDGEYTQVMKKNFKDLNRFWDIDASNIILVGMHGAMLRDREKLILADMITYGDSRAVAEYWADFILDLLASIPQYRNGDHPIFTFNAFAATSWDWGQFGISPDKIVMGDGILEAYEALGYGDVAPQAILAHEFGHHIQFQLDLFSDVRTPEATRRTELMADAFSAYYLAHSRGQSMNWKRVRQFLQVFFNIGDCAFTSTGHHGTPEQRMAAADWAYQVVQQSQKQGHILGAAQFAAMFDAALPQIVAN